MRMLSVLIILLFPVSVFGKSRKLELHVHELSANFMEKFVLHHSQENLKHVLKNLESLRGSGPVKVYGEFERQPGTKFMRASAGVQTSF